jgi:hypothetical protein
MDAAGLQGRIRRELEQRSKALVLEKDLAYWLNTYIVGAGHGDIEQIERIHTLLYGHFKAESASMYRRFLQRLNGDERQLSEVVEVIDFALRDWCTSLISLALNRSEESSKMIVQSKSPDFASCSAEFATTVNHLLTDVMMDAKVWIVDGELMKPAKDNTSAPTNSLVVNVDHNSTLYMRDMHAMQSGTGGGDVDLPQLARELEKLRTEMKKQAVDTAHDRAVGAIADAEDAAKQGDRASVIKYLRKSGTWAWECATKIGVSIASEAIKQSIGLRGS